MKRIKLTKEEKATLLNVSKNGSKQPRELSPIAFHFALSLLQEKGLVEYKNNYDEVLEAKLTIKAKAYLECNPNLKNPVPWKDIVLITLSAITVISTFIALFISCSISLSK